MVRDQAAISRKSKVSPGSGVSPRNAKPEKLYAFHSSPLKTSSAVVLHSPHSAMLSFPRPGQRTLPSRVNQGHFSGCQPLHLPSPFLPSNFPATDDRAIDDG